MARLVCQQQYWRDMHCHNSSALSICLAGGSGQLSGFAWRIDAYCNLMRVLCESQECLAVYPPNSPHYPFHILPSVTLVVSVLDPHSIAPVDSTHACDQQLKY